MLPVKAVREAVITTLIEWHDKFVSIIYSEVSRSSSTYYGHTHEFSGTANIKSGTTYKLVTTATVTRNGSSETVSNTFEKKC